ncbi:fucose 4-O-acetylase [Paenibacillus thiaminolyticus]|uniref:Fucose 4-O-acetylase n=1 Tax=Paenibacillus thiaminolyticus TaxID=49283 RepID=A0AAP9DYL9_PANTH|nr:acyltransferase family protein [Paenibacillus thiaminolyticus]MCY9535365.1 fucose 4-O-acetylase [Paenibacillus thiaminolyticus]MCY9603358.1 fucose 4-O-acetylase [Paenibacillus thiaminolyticus]MCY9607399.1 fucose 4-O-acetylase [Paenibacillus thiaminolyticus]MCY9616457.1 fucose 4-O-acetylase [Paenibacillus thiaminolyticus]MCY9621259.1 fucose 4-O-acetylase [Paenibacillus thiaminolyticus]
MQERRWNQASSGLKSAVSLRSGETFGLNLRFMLIVCVFIANAIEPLIGTMPELKSLFVWIFTFHMPLFVFVTGYFARSNLNGRAGWAVMKQIGIQYVIFQSLYSLLDVTLFHVPGMKHSFFIPYLLLWFLIGHLIWRAILMLFNRWQVRHPVILAAIIGIAAGFLPIDGAWLGLSRTLVYLPFFAFGYVFRDDAIQRFAASRYRKLAAGLSVGLLIVLLLWPNVLHPEWLMNHMTFRELGWLEQSPWYAIGMRLFIYALEIVASVAFLAWVPLHTGWITGLGRRTLYVFLLHGLIIRLLVVSGLYHYITTGPQAVLLIAASLACTVLLAQPAVRSLCRPIIEPHWNGLGGWHRMSVFHRGMKQG